MQDRPPVPGELLGLGPGQRPDALPAGREVLGQEGLDLLAVRLGLGRVGGLHAAEGSARVSGDAHGDTEAAQADRRRADERAVGPEAGRTDPQPRAKSSRARRSISAWAASKNGAPKPSATDPATTASAQVEQRRHRGHGPADEQAGARDRRPHRPRRPARPVIAAMAVPDASASRQPWLPQRQARPSGSTITWPMWPALPSAPSSRRPSSTIPPPTPVDTTMARKSATAPRPRPASPRPAPAPWRRCRRTVGQAERVGQARPQREVAPGRDVEGRDGLARRRHRTAGAHPAHDRSRPSPLGAPRPHLGHQRQQRGRTAPRPSRPAASAPGRGRAISPADDTSPAASLVPPMSMARAGRRPGPGSPSPGASAGSTGPIAGRYPSTGWPFAPMDRGRPT